LEEGRYGVMITPKKLIGVGCLLGVYFLLCFVGLIYVAIHFIAKVW